MALSPTEQKFILHWGEMGTRWGINRTVAQVHALLFLSPKPLHAEEIASTLVVARSNVSTSLRELQGWGIVRVAHVLGDRRDHFESVKDAGVRGRTEGPGERFSLQPGTPAGDAGVSDHGIRVV